MRIRSLKPEFWTDRVTGRLSHAAKLLYMGLWNFADDEGRFEWEPDLIRAQLFPYEASFPISEALEELCRTGRIGVYEAEGSLYGVVFAFKDHQHPKRVYASKLPAPSTLIPWDTVLVGTRCPPAVPHPSPTGSPVVPQGVPPTVANWVPVVGEGEGEGEGVTTLARSAALQRPAPEPLMGLLAANEPMTETQAPVSAEPCGPVSPFVAFVQEHWPDVKHADEFEQLAREAFPAVDPLVEAKKAFGWEHSDAKRRKHNHGKFLWGWLGRAQDAANREAMHTNGARASPNPRIGMALPSPASAFEEDFKF